MNSSPRDMLIVEAQDIKEYQILRLSVCRPWYLTKQTPPCGSSIRGSHLCLQGSLNLFGISDLDGAGGLRKLAFTMRESAILAVLSAGNCCEAHDERRVERRRFHH
jgi:hypothetical protein